MGGFVKFVHHNENAGFNQEKNWERNQSQLFASESLFLSFIQLKYFRLIC